MHHNNLTIRNARRRIKFEALLTIVDFKPAEGSYTTSNILFRALQVLKKMTMIYWNKRVHCTWIFLQTKDSVQITYYMSQVTGTMSSLL